MNSIIDDLIEAVTQRSLLVIFAVLLLTGFMFWGASGIGPAPGVSDQSSLDQFESDNNATRAQTYINENFGGDDNTTPVQIVIRNEGGNTLTKDSFERSLELQQELRNNETVNESLDDQQFGDVASIVAVTAISEDVRERSDELEERGEQLNESREELEADSQELNATAQELSDGINRTIGLQRQYIDLNASRQRGEVSDQEYQQRAAAIESNFTAVEQNATTSINDTQSAAYASLLADARSIVKQKAAVARQNRTGELSDDEARQRQGELDQELQEVYQGIRDEVLAGEIAALGARGERLQEDGEELQEDIEELQEFDPTNVTIEQQREQIESMNESEVQEIVDEVLGEDADQEVLGLVPKDYDPGSGEEDQGPKGAEARQVVILQSTDSGSVSAGEAGESLVDQQLAIQDIVDRTFADGPSDAFTFGAGIVTDEIDRSNGDSFQLVLPLAFVFVLGVLAIAYRDPIDIVLGLSGIGLVLVWTFGFMAWTGIAFNQIMIAVPVLLVGLSIDYAIHVFMRHREQRTNGTEDTRDAMKFVLVGLGVALLWVTITAVIGFLANLVSDVGPIRDFGVVSAFGITSTMILFTTIIPAAKVATDDFLEEQGWDRKKRAFGTGGGPFSAFLSYGRKAAKVSPAAVLLVALLVTAAAGYGAFQVDTSFNQDDFIADEPADWMQSLPGPMAPGEYTVKSNLDFVNDNFVREDTSTQILIPQDPDDTDDDITTDDTLEQVQNGTDAAADEPDVAKLGSGNANIQSPVTVMQDVAAQNESFNETFSEADTDGDRVPDRNLEEVYDEFFAAAPEDASDVIHRTDDGEYRAIRMEISINGSASPGEATDATEAVAEEIEADDGPSAVATGQLVVFNAVEDDLLRTVIESLVLTLVSVFLFLMIVYRVTRDSATLGVVTLLPIALSVAWILGTMFLLDIPFNFVTGTITALTIGLGVAYNIHLSERYQLELDRGKNVWEALEAAVTGTGGALLGSAGTTAGGFGVLAFAILPPLQDFGIITGITIIYAFLGSVFLLPSFLVLWTKYAGPADRFPDSDAATSADEPDIGTPTRFIEPKICQPGDTCTVVIEIPEIEGNVFVEETAPLDGLEVVDVEPEPVDAIESGDRIFVEFGAKTPSTATIRYTGRVPARTTSAEPSFGGTINIDGGEVGIDGDIGIEVIEDGFERDIRSGGVTEGELRAAGNALRDGQITEEQYRRIVNDWLEDGTEQRAIGSGDAVSGVMAEETGDDDAGQGEAPD